jgi:plasmid stabilization system protein ParE
MLEYRVVVQPEGERNITVILSRIAARSAQGAGRWYQALSKAIERLRLHADSLPLAPESRHFDFEIRELLFKTRRGLPYRILFTIQQTEVHVLFVRGPGQDWVQNPD